MTEKIQISKVTFAADVTRQAGRRIFICRHFSPPRALSEIAKSHELDAALEAKYDLKWLTYYVNGKDGTSFCLAEAPSKEALKACHLEAHGPMMPYRVEEVDWRLVEVFLGPVLAPAPGFPWAETPLRTFLAAEIAEEPRSQELSVGVAGKFEQIIREATAPNNGREVERTGEAVLVCFSSAVRAVESAIAAQRAISIHNAEKPKQAFVVRIGLHSGEPLSDDGELFGPVADISRRICEVAAPAAILVSGRVRDLCSDKGLYFEEQGFSHLRGIFLDLYKVSIEVAGSHPSRYADGLTQREVAVLRLLAVGKSNQQIGNDLVISPNTVARHVAHILQKIDAANRTEAAVYAYRERLI